MGFNRKRLLSEIANSALFGSLGFFVGTGFSKAMTDGEAPSFDQLISDIKDKLEIEYDLTDSELVRGKSYPRIAQEIVEALRTKKGDKSQRRSSLILKREICNRCSLRPEETATDAFRKLFKDIPIQWVITTNYDFLLEHVIPSSVYLLPDQYLNARQDFVPIYHLHGHCRSPSSVIITEQDYVNLMSPTEYRQLKLNLLLAESTTVMLGYSLGDVNVQTAMSWAKVFEGDKGVKRAPYQSLIVQARYTRKPKNDPYIGANGEHIIEVQTIAGFLQEIVASINQKKKRHRGAKRLLKDFMTKDLSGELLISDHKAREEFVGLLSKFPRCYEVQVLIEFLEEVLGPVWSSARKTDGFEYYDVFLNLLLDILENLPYEDCHPSLFAYIADKLDDVASYIDPDRGKEYGTGFEATKTWFSRRGDIPEEMYDALRGYANVHGGYRLQRILKN